LKEFDLDRLVAEQVFPGAVLLISQGGRVRYRQSAGRQTYDAHSPAVDAGTIYDLASVTKVFVSATVIELIEAGDLGLEDPVRRYLSQLSEDKSSITVRQLLTHTAGLPSAPRLHNVHRTSKALTKTICEIPLQSQPGTQVLYSSLGYQYLGWLVEAVLDAPLSQCLQSRLLNPFGVEAWFTPPAELRSRIAPTEFSTQRGKLLQGEVHDENSGVLGGATGHAGLFATASGVLALGHALLEKRSPLLFRELTAGLLPARTAAFLIDDPEFASWPTSAYSHTGFTGTSICLVPQRSVAVVLVSNRVHPSRDSERIHPARRSVHEFACALTAGHLPD